MARRTRSSTLAFPLLVVVVLLVAACGSGSDAASGEQRGGTASVPSSSAGGRGDCPTDPVRVVVSVDQWGDVARSLGGDCAAITTIVTSSTGDPHEFEPTPADIAAFGDAQLVVVNGLGYDEWATKAVDALDRRPVVVDARAVGGRSTGDNPHVWYDPMVVQDVATEVTKQLDALAPAASAYFGERSAAWSTALEPYRTEIDRIAGSARGRTYAATEPVFDDMASALGLRDLTPKGYRKSSANESEPAPADIAAFESLLSDGKVDVLVFNTQTEGSVPDQLRRAAEAADVPVVEVTETVPTGTGFVEWQVAQLRSLAAALGATP